jgi:alpha-1,2-mannosyltransferase
VLRNVRKGGLFPSIRLRWPRHFTPERGVRTGPWSAAPPSPTRLNLLVHRFEALGDRLRAFAQPWEIASFIWVPGIAMGFAAWWEFRSRDPLQDFGIFRAAALEVVHGHSPYVTPSAAAFSHFDKFVYPPVAALFFAPFAALPAGASRVLMFLAGVLAIFAALRLLRVEDWRCYSVVIISAPAINTLALGALTSFLFLGTALVWRYRDNTWVAALATAFTAVLKLFLWPLGVWLIATRRWRAAVICMAAALVLLLGGWAVIDFAGLSSYPRLVHLLEQVEAPASYSTIALIGLGGGAETAVTVSLSLAAVAGIWFAARGTGGDRRALAVAVVASLFVTPLVWLHYLLLLFVPIALYRPRLSGLWFVPLALWLTPTTHSHGTTWRIALSLAVVAVVALRTVGASSKPELSRAGVAPRPVAS